MSNRNHRTLSAHHNRLDLGTRSLALTAGVNTGALHLRFRLSHSVSRTFDRRPEVTRPIDPAIMPDMQPWPSSGSLQQAVQGYPKPYAVKPRSTVAVAELPPVEQEVVPHDPACPGSRSAEPLRSGAALAAPAAGTRATRRVGAFARS